MACSAVARTAASSGRPRNDQRRGLPLALCQRQHLVAVSVGDASLIENRHAVVQAFQPFGFGREAVKLRVAYRDMQPLFEYLAAARQLVIELDHAASDVEHDSGLALVHRDHTNNGALTAEIQPVQAVRGHQRRFPLTPRQEPARGPWRRVRVLHRADKVTLPIPQPQRRQRARALRHLHELLAERPEPGRTRRPRTERQRSLVNCGLGPRLHGRLQTWHSQ
jgi:hypothetical protein